MTIQLDRRELAGLAFACLPDCGFCCTFQPEVSKKEAAVLRARITPLLVSHDEDGRQHLQLQGGCGACTLLKDKACTQYDARPAHCRYFPFHVYFGARPEVYVNYACRGVERRAGGDLSREFQESVLGVAAAEAIAAGAEAGVAAHAEFRRRARRAGAWADPAPLLAEAAADAEALLSHEGLTRWMRRAGIDLTPEAAATEGLLAFHPEEDPGARPYYLAPDLRWLTFERRDERALAVLAMSERGTFEAQGEIAPRLVEALPPEARAALAPYLRRLLARGIFLGSVFDRVDESRYALPVARALAGRVAEVASDLHVRARMVEAILGDVPPARLAEEVARFYDSEFLDAPTIGGFL